MSASAYEIRLDLLRLAFDIVAYSYANTGGDVPTQDNIVAVAKTLNAFVSNETRPAR